MKLYDTIFQCAICNETTYHFLTDEKWQVGDETINGLCHQCKEEDEDTGIVTHIEEDVPIDKDEIESLTAWVIPQSRYPKRDWLTTKEAADEAGLPKSTVQTWIDRGKLFEAQIRGLIQKTSSITLIHRSVVDQLKKMK